MILSICPVTDKIMSVTASAADGAGTITVSSIDISGVKEPKAGEIASVDNLIYTGSPECKVSSVCRAFWYSRDNADGYFSVEETGEVFKAGLEYRFYCYIDLETGYVFDGPDNFELTVNGKAVEFEIENFDIDNCAVSVIYKCESDGSLSADLTVNNKRNAQDIQVGASVNINPRAAGGKAPYTYQYLMRTSTNGKDMVLKDYSAVSKYVAPLKSVGTKIFTVNVKDSTGEVVKSNSVTIYCKKCVKKVEITGAGTPKQGEKACVDGVIIKDDFGNELIDSWVHWYVCDTEDGYFESLDDGEEFVYGKYYQLCCGLNTEEDYLFDELGNFSVTTVVVGGKAPYTYQYLMRNSANGSDIILKDFSTATSYTGALKSEGTKIFTVMVKDGTGEYATSNSVTVNACVEPEISAVLTVNDEQEKVSVTKGAQVILKTVASGGYGKLQYKYVMKNETTGQTIVLKDYSSATSYKGTITSIGKKCLQYM